jgi:hypothetical protein
MRVQRLATFALLLVLAQPLAAQEEDKPLRELSTDRPDQTESPYSVDAGHLQVESEPISYGVTHEAGVSLYETRVMAMNVRFGVTDRIDAQLVLSPLVHLREEAGGVSRTHTGFGDTVVRAKINLFGNDEGDVALGLLPFVALPIASNAALGIGQVEFGLAVPLGIALPLGFALGVMEQVDLVEGARADYVATLTQTLTVGHDVVGDLGAFAEVASTLTFEGGTEASLELHGGLTYGIGDDIQLDAGVFGTLLGSGEDVRGFLGFTMRI